MQARDRHAFILEVLGENNMIRINEIARTCDVSQETARRDLEILQEQGLVKRIHGGAIMNMSPRSAASTETVCFNQEEKMAIGRLAATTVHNGETIFLDTGTTVLELARNLKRHHGLTVITYSIAVLNELLNSNCRIIMLGGEVRSDEQFVYSQETEQMFSRYFVERAFFSCGGITFRDGITDYGPTINRESLAAHSTEMILLADSNKFNKNAQYKSCELDLVDTFIIDSRIDEQTFGKLQDLGKTIKVAEVSLGTSPRENG